MTSRQLTLEHLLFAAALALALGLRLLSLGAAPLSDAEAGWALQALSVARSQPVTIGPQPAYAFLTGSTMYLLGSSNFLARLWPALLGSLLVLMPFFFRDKLGRRAALILAIALAVDPGLVALSRQAGGPMLALSSILLALALWYARRPVLAGICAALALLAGPDVLHGVLGLALAWGVLALLESAGVFSSSSNDELSELPPVNSREAWISALLAGLLAGGIAFLAVGTQFLRYPQGLGAFVSQLPAYLTSWTRVAGIPLLRLLAVLFIYQPLALLFAIIGIFSGREHRATAAHFGLLWLILAVLLALLHPAHQAADLVWALVPLWGLAALGIDAVLEGEAEGWRISLLQAALVFILLCLFWLNLAGLSMDSFSANRGLRLAIMLGALGLTILTSVLVWLGWSLAIARHGLALGVLAALGIALLSTTWGVSQLRPDGPEELWSPASSVGQADLLSSTLQDLSVWHTGEGGAIDVTVAVDSPALHWLLRDYYLARYLPETQSLNGLEVAGQQPSVVIAWQNEEAPSLSATYRGQDFAWRITPGWPGAFPPDFALWLAFRQAPIQMQSIVLWARSDLFPGGGEPDAAPAVEQPGEALPPILPAP
jgi:hypothetical protein